MIIISSAKMGNGTFQAKFVPLAKNEQVEKIFVLRKTKGPEIAKVQYIVLPKICNFFIFNVLFTPLILTFYAIKLKANIILTYHFVPHAFFGFFASLLTGKPHVFGQTGSECQTLSQKPILKQLIRKVLKQTKFILTPGPNSKNYWIEQHQINPLKIKLLHSTINTDVFLPEESSYKYDFIYVGRLHAIKKVDEILKGFLLLKDKGMVFKVCIVGDGDEREILEKYVNDNKLSTYVDFKGFDKDIYKYLKISKIFVTASIMEGLPVALMEAMSSEKLVITSNVGNIPYLVKHNKNGFMFNNGDYTILHKFMENAFINYSNYNTLRKEARKTVIQNHSYKAVNSKWNAIFNTLKK